jgi:hypothetical protein
LSDSEVTLRLLTLSISAGTADGDLLTNCLTSIGRVLLMLCVLVVLDCSSNR